MGKFQFQDNCIHLDIDGNQFDIPATEEYVTRLKAWGKEAQERASSLQDAPDGGAADITGFMLNMLDALLGSGASGQIFKERTPNLFDCIGVLNYISDEFNEFQERKTRELTTYTAKYSPARAEQPKQILYPMPMKQSRPNVLQVEKAMEILKAAGYEPTR